MQNRRRGQGAVTDAAGKCRTVRGRGAVTEAAGKCRIVGVAKEPLLRPPVSAEPSVAEEPLLEAAAECRSDRPWPRSRYLRPPVSAEPFVAEEPLTQLRPPVSAEPSVAAEPLLEAPTPGKCLSLSLQKLVKY